MLEFLRLLITLSPFLATNKILSDFVSFNRRAKYSIYEPYILICDLLKDCIFFSFCFFLKETVLFEIKTRELNSALDLI